MIKSNHNIWNIILNALGVLVSLLALYFAWSSYKNTLPLSGPNLSFSEESIKVVYIKDAHAEIKNDYIEITPILKNIGKASALNVGFKIFVAYINPSYRFKEQTTHLVKVFDDLLAHDLQPDSVATFGALNLGRMMDGKEIKDIDLLKNKAEVLLLFSLKYNNPLLKDNTENRCYAFKYAFGTGAVFTLLSSEYKKYYEWVREYETKNGELVCDKM